MKDGRKKGTKEKKKVYKRHFESKTDIESFERSVNKWHFARFEAIHRLAVHQFITWPVNEPIDFVERHWRI